LPDRCHIVENKRLKKKFTVTLTCLSFSVRRHAAITDKANWPVSVHVASWWSGESVSATAKCYGQPASAALTNPATATAQLTISTVATSNTACQREQHP